MNLENIPPKPILECRIKIDCNHPFDDKANLEEIFAENAEKIKAESQKKRLQQAPSTMPAVLPAAVKQIPPKTPKVRQVSPSTPKLVKPAPAAVKKTSPPKVRVKQVIPSTSIVIQVQPPAPRVTPSSSRTTSSITTGPTTSFATTIIEKPAKTYESKSEAVSETEQNYLKLTSLVTAVNKNSNPKNIKKLETFYNKSVESLEQTTNSMHKQQLKTVKLFLSYEKFKLPKTTDKRILIEKKFILKDYLDVALAIKFNSLKPPYRKLYADMLENMTATLKNVNNSLSVTKTRNSTIT